MADHSNSAGRLGGASSGGSGAQGLDFKGKGRAPYQDDVAMGEGDDSSDEESGVEDVGEPEEEDEDNMEEIDVGNILMDGRRTRGKQIDFAKAAAETKDLDDDDDDEDEDFEAAGDAMEE